MKIVTHTDDELVVTHREPASRILAVSLCLGFMLLVPIALPRLWPEIGPAPTWVEVLLVALFTFEVIYAAIIYRSREVYSFSRSRHTFSIRRYGPFGSTSCAGKLTDIKAVYQERVDDNDVLKEFVTIVLADEEKIHLPWRALSFTQDERAEFGRALAGFYGFPVRLDES